MKLITPILGGFACLMAVLAFAFYFINPGQDNRGTTVGYFVGASVVFVTLAFISTLFKKKASVTISQVRVNKSVRQISLMIIVPVLLFIAAIYLLAWWFGKSYTF